MQLEGLRIDRELGYQYAVLFASEWGIPLILELGFQDTGPRISRYLWRNGYCETPELPSSGVDPRACLLELTVRRDVV